MKRLLSAFFAVILLLSCFAGCKKKSAGTETTITTQPTGTAPIATVPQTESTRPNTENNDNQTPTAPIDGLSLEENGVVYESLAQKAVVKTALAYLARGTRIQYDDSRLNPKSAPGSSSTLYRWQSGVRKAPEEYTSQYTGYTNCAAFTNEVYRAALDISSGANSTDRYADIKGDTRAYRYNPTGNETAEEQAAVKEEFLSTLKMGDIIVVRRKNGTGHAMLYVGSKVLEGVEGYKGAASEGVDENNIPKDNGYIYDIIHSTGSSYNYEKQTENFEKHGTIQITAANSMFDSRSNSYVFGKLTSLTLIRPLNTFKGEVPENSLNRLQNLHNIIAEKLSSHAAGMTVNPGDSITYIFSITNKNQSPVTLEIKDIVPENTTFVSSENCTVDGTNLTWSITVPAGETIVVPYTVKVNADTPIGTLIGNDAGTVGGVLVKCPKNYVGTTLTEDQQAALQASIATYTDSSLRGMTLADVIYSSVKGYENMLTDDVATVLSKTFRSAGDYHYIEWEANPYRDAIVPGMFGGRYVPQREMSVKLAEQVGRHEQNRTRKVDEMYLMTGDILIASTNADGSDIKMYMYTGEMLLDLSTCKLIPIEETDTHLMTFLSYNRFVVIRPSLMKDSK